MNSCIIDDIQCIFPLVRYTEMPSRYFYSVCLEKSCVSSNFHMKFNLSRFSDGHKVGEYIVQDNSFSSGKLVPEWDSDYKMVKC